MNPNIICSLFHDGRRFDWEGNNGSAFASDLAGNHDPFCRVYNDACDLGFGIRGKHREVIFRIEHTERDRDNDIVWWELISISESGFTVKVWND